MIESIQRVVRKTDDAVASVYLAMFQERGALLSFLFHSLFRDESEISRNLIDPLQRTTLRQLREMIAYYLSHGYQFISPDRLLEGLPPANKYVLLTFDDGYFNNMPALPILEEFGVPALFFICTDNVLRGKCFWWDALYRELMGRGTSPGEAYIQALAMKALQTEQIEEKLIERFGPDVLKPHGDIDRPFSIAELRDFARNKYVHLGNHTANHAILTNYSAAQMRDQIGRAQDVLRDTTGKAPNAIAYPNGAFNKEVVDVCRDAGFKLGFTIRSGKARLPLVARDAGLMEMKRFIPHGNSPMAVQCQTCRSDLAIYGTFRDCYVRLMRTGVSA